jgi:cytochrome c peroxidase
MNYKKIFLMGCITIFVCTVALAQDFKYIGAAKCKMCHNNPEKGGQFKSWSESKHANSMKVLNAAEAKNPKCLKCHSTAAAAGEGLIETITIEEGVSCESCHGPGSAYKVISIMKDRTKSMSKGLILAEEKVCKKCHNEESPNYKGFNFIEYSKKIAHPNPIRAK